MRDRHFRDMACHRVRQKWGCWCPWKASKTARADKMKTKMLAINAELVS